jgi:hypothetical protein
MNTKFRLELMFLILILILSTSSIFAQQKEYLAMIPPFHDRFQTPNAESPLQLKQQRFVLFIYQNAVVVYSEAVFLNSGLETINQELSLPSTGHDENGDRPGGRISNGILSVHLWVEGEQVNPQIINEGNEEWYTINTRFEPGESRKVNALFWVQTSLTDIDSLPGLDSAIIKDGKRGFLVNLAHAGIWRDYIESVDVIAVLNDGVLKNLNPIEIQPQTYELKDSTMTWTFNNIEPTEDDNVYISYTTSCQENSQINSMAKLSKYIVQDVYKELISYYDQLYEE